MTEPTENRSPPPGWLQANQALWTAFKERGVEMRPCSVCGEPNSFQLGEGYFVASTSERGDHFALGGRGWPLLPLVCGKCGNTVFLNAVRLGLGLELFTGSA